MVSLGSACANTALLALLVSHAIGCNGTVTYTTKEGSKTITFGQLASALQGKQSAVSNASPPTQSAAATPRVVSTPRSTSTPTQTANREVPVVRPPRNRETASPAKPKAVTQRSIAEQVDQLVAKMDELKRETVMLAEARADQDPDTILVRAFMDAIMGEVKERLTRPAVKEIEQRVLRRMPRPLAVSLAESGALRAAGGMIASAWTLIDLSVQLDHARAAQEQARVLEWLQIQLKELTPIAAQQAVDAREAKRDQARLEECQRKAVAERKRLDDLLTRFEETRSRIESEEAP